MKFSTVLVLVPLALAAPSTVQPNVEVRDVAVAPSADVEAHIAVEARCSQCQNVVTGIVGAIDNLGNSIEDNLQSLQSILAGPTDGLGPVALANLVNRLRDQIQPLTRDLAQAARNIVGNVINGVQDLENVVKSLAKGQILSLASAVRKAQALAQRIKDLLDQLDSLPSPVEDPLEGDIENLEKALENLLAPLLAFINAVCENANAEGGATGILGGALDGVLNVVDGLLDGLGLGGLLDGLTGGSTDDLGNLGDLGSLGGVLQGLLGSSSSLLSNLGVNV